jgi:hypothetical protein
VVWIFYVFGVPSSFVFLWLMLVVLKAILVLWDFHSAATAARVRLTGPMARK